MTLEEYRKLKKLTMSQLAGELDMERTFVNRLCIGRRKPSLSTALKIEANTRGAVTPKDWDAERAA